jgi:hypothetical protein
MPEIGQWNIARSAGPNAAAYFHFSVDLGQQLFSLRFGLLHCYQAHEHNCCTDAHKR